MTELDRVEPNWRSSIVTGSGGDSPKKAASAALAPIVQNAWTLTRSKAATRSQQQRRTRCGARARQAAVFGNCGNHRLGSHFDHASARRMMRSQS